MYCITRKEILAIYYYVTYFKHYLLGNKFIIRTDHKALQWLMNWRNPSTSQYYRWIGELSVYDFIIEHRSGVDHTNADFLSRLYGDCQQCELQHENPQRRRNVKLVTEKRIRVINESLLPMEKEVIVQSYHACLGHLGIEKNIEFIA